MGDLGLIPGLERFPGEGKSYPRQYSGLKNSMDSPLGHKKSDRTEQLSCSLAIISYNPLYFCIVYCNLSFFNSNFVDLILLSFFLMSLVRSFVNFVNLLKEPAFSLLIFSIISFISFSLSSALIL